MYFNFYSLHILVMVPVTRNQFEKLVDRNLKEDFFSIYLPYLMIVLKFRRTLDTSKNHQKEKIPCSSCTSTHYIMALPKPRWVLGSITNP